MHRTGYAIIPCREELSVTVYYSRFCRIVVYSQKLVIYEISMARVLDFKQSLSVVRSLETVMTLHNFSDIVCYRVMHRRNLNIPTHEEVSVAGYNSRFCFDQYQVLISCAGVF